MPAATEGMSNKVEGLTNREVIPHRTVDAPAGKIT
jgi:hypothetical protein